MQSFTEHSEPRPTLEDYSSSVTGVLLRNWSVRQLLRASQEMTRSDRRQYEGENYVNVFGESDALMLGVRARDRRGESEFSGCGRDG